MNAKESYLLLYSITHKTILLSSLEVLVHSNHQHTGTNHVNDTAKFVVLSVLEKQK